MDTRGKRRVIIASIVTVSLLVVAAIGVGVFFTIRTQHRNDDVKEAASVAKTFNRDVSRYRSSVSSAISGADQSNAKEMRKAVDAAVAKAPKLGSAPAWGRTHSRSYAMAAKSQKTLTAPYEDISTVLDEAVIGQPFVKAAHDALAVDLDHFVKGGTLPNGGPIRKKLIPGYQKLLAKFDKVEVPKGQDRVAGKVRAALRAVLKDARKAADDLDSGRGGSINARSEYLAASSAVFAYETSLRSRISAAILKAKSKVSGEADAT